MRRMVAQAFRTPGAPARELVHGALQREHPGGFAGCAREGRRHGVAADQVVDPLVGRACVCLTVGSERRLRPVVEGRRELSRAVLVDIVDDAKRIAGGHKAIVVDIDRP